ncbi:hypothetical protein [Streptomyces asiaticus]
MFDEDGICATIAIVGPDNTLSMSDDAPELSAVVETARALTHELGGHYRPAEEAAERDQRAGERDQDGRGEVRRHDAVELPQIELVERRRDEREAVPDAIARGADARREPLGQVRGDRAERTDGEDADHHTPAEGRAQATVGDHQSAYEPVPITMTDRP